jgi:hypothetical protein
MRIRLLASFPTYAALATIFIGSALSMLTLV